jgi:hypothetical protein
MQNLRLMEPYFQMKYFYTQKIRSLYSLKSNQTPLLVARGKTTVTLTTANS